jgi:hypothetical protein
VKSYDQALTEPPKHHLSSTLLCPDHIDSIDEPRVPSCVEGVVNESLCDNVKGEQTKEQKETGSKSIDHDQPRDLNLQISFHAMPDSR